MKEIVIASRNKKKIAELVALLPDFRILSLDDIGFHDEIPEPFVTFRENALQKAKTVFDFCGKDTLADDSGISVPALNNEPGVFSARYAGEHATDGENLQLLLTNMDGLTDRRAFYTAMLCFYSASGPHFFEGICKGTLIEVARGTNGFGYDPCFVPEGFSQTFGELDAAVKQAISHRAKAMNELRRFLRPDTL